MVYVPPMSVSALVDLVNFGHGDDLVVVQKEEKVTYRQLRGDRTILAKAFLQLGVKKGDIIAVGTSRSIYENILIFLAANQIGAMVCFFDEKTTYSVLTGYLEEFAAPILITYQKSEKYIEKIKGDVKSLKKVINLDGSVSIDGFLVGKTDVMSLAQKYRGRLPKMLLGGQNEALISFTSGSTSGPKPMVFTNENLIAAAMFPKKTSGIKLHDKEITSWMSFVKFDCPYGFWTSVMTPILGGSSVILTPDICAENYAYYLAQKPRAISGVPLLLESFRATLPEEIDLSSVKLFVSGGERLEEDASRDALAFFKAHGSEVRICNGYGVGETLGCVSIAVGASYRPGTVGRIVDGVDAMLLDAETEEPVAPGKVGMLYISGKHILKRYFNRPDLDEMKILMRNGKRWVKTGDLAYLSDGGFLTLIGRATFFINSLPAKVYYEVVRTAVSKADDLVRSCYVVKMPHKELGYATIAFVVPEEGVGRNEKTRKAILARAAEPFYFGKKRLQLKSYELPKKVVFLDSLPLTKANKTDFRKLEQMAKELAETL